MNRFTLVLRQRMTALQAFALSNIPDSLLLSGTASVSYGAWLIYAPAGFIVAGVLLLIAGVLASRTSD